MSIVHPCGIELYVEFFWNNFSWTDNTDRVRSATIQSSSRSRGGSGVFDPGRATFVLDNRDRAFDPLFSSGAYFGNLKPGRLARVRFDPPFTTIQDVWWGWTDRLGIDYHPSNNDSTTTVQCVDELARAAFTDVPAGVTPGLTDGENAFNRLAQIAATNNYGPEPQDQAGVNWVARYSGQSRWDATRNHTIIDEYRRAMDVEQGVAVASTTGGIDIYSRNWWKLRTRSNVVQATFGGTGEPIYALQRADDSDELITAVAMVDEVGNAVVSIDANGEQEYGTRWPSANLTDLPSFNDEDLEGAANALLAVSAVETSRLESLVVKAAASPTIAFYVATLQVLDRIRVTWTPTRVGPAVTADYFIDGVTHQITPDEWTTTYALRPCAPFDAAVPGTLFTVGSSLVGGPHVVGL